MSDNDISNKSIIKFLSFDIDNTLIDFKTHKTNFNKVWKKHKSNGSPILSYNTGRLIDDVLMLIDNETLPQPDYIIGGVGTLIYDYKNRSIIKEFNDILDEGWDIQSVEEVIQKIDHPISEQPNKYQHAYKRSYFLHNASESLLAQIEKDFADANMHINVVYSGEQYLDILPKWANKGNALQWLLKKLNIDLNETLVAGDSGNDSAMFNMKNIKGIVVANAHEELYKFTKHRQIYHSESIHGDGVIEGLVYYGILPKEALIDSSQDHTDDFFIQRELYHVADEDKDEKIALIEEGYYKAIEASKKILLQLDFPLVQ